MIIMFLRILSLHHRDRYQLCNLFRQTGIVDYINDFTHILVCIGFLFRQTALALTADDNAFGFHFS